MINLYRRGGGTRVALTHHTKSPLSITMGSTNNESHGKKNSNLSKSKICVWITYVSLAVLVFLQFLNFLVFQPAAFSIAALNRPPLFARDDENGRIFFFKSETEAYYVDSCNPCKNEYTFCAEPNTDPQYRVPLLSTKQLPFAVNTKFLQLSFFNKFVCKMHPMGIEGTKEMNLRTGVVKPEPLGLDEVALDFLQIGLADNGDSICMVDKVNLDHFPPSFDQTAYETRNRNKVSQGVTLNYHHYISEGREKGFFSSEGTNLRSILPSLISDFPGDSLEIGPGIMPVLKGERVKYFDILNLQGLKDKMGQYLVIDPDMREIDYVVPNGDLSKIPGNPKFSLVFSAHVIEHQLDLVVHLQQVASFLEDGGYYALMVPDKRYCYDHWVARTSITEVLDDYLRNETASKIHKPRNFIEGAYGIAHHGASDYWAGNASIYLEEKSRKYISTKIKGFIDLYRQTLRDGSFVDVHNYRFIPQSMAFLVRTLYDLDLIDLRVHRVYETILDGIEFAIVLKKCTSRDTKRTIQDNHLN